MIRIQAEDFDPGAEIARLSAGNTAAGAVASFVGLVRGDDDLQAMTLEHYPGMTERQLAAIENEARNRWRLLDVVIVHRYGRLLPGDRIVLVAAASSHRGDAFAACEFLMDWLKTKAPFWKMEERAGRQDWVEAKSEDDSRAERW
ncbi:MAG TPA: molybdenum cofactor biosynthesis protein MoaE [Candidatus Sulfotelmatobacter sp.]|nr:molybdenum cofactor biosynthesis protein MoaE [Candidatus Sulfotelmatobacter sp.]